MPRDLTRRSFLTAVGVGGLLAASGCSINAVTSGASGLISNEPELEPTRGWYIRPGQRAPASLIEAYAGSTSIAAGDRLTLHVSTAADAWTAEVFRIGDYNGLGGAKVATAGPFRGQSQAGPGTDSVTRAISADWPAGGEVDTSDWKPGFYLVHAIAKNKRVDMPLVVRSDSAKGAVVMIGSSTTWAAYNLWGARSLYRSEGGGFGDRSHAVSADRPYDRTGIALVHAFEIPLIRVAEGSGVSLAYFTNTDVGLNPKLLEGAVAAVSTGHDEYWPTGYRDGLQRVRAAGGNLAFFGANGGYWRVRLSDTENGPGRLVTCYKSADLDPVKNSPQTTARWRDDPDPRPENEIIGQLYDAFPVSGAMRIRDPDFFLFKDTDVREGSTLTGLIGPETDRYYPHENTPRPIQIPALSEVTCRGSKTWSTMTYYTTESGGGVLATGTMSWTRSLPRPTKMNGISDATTRFSHHVTLNAFRALAAGPMGNNNPARDDSSNVDLPSRNTSGAA